jgi:uncharacterized tellurite resistance protein B-like protein
MHEQDKAILMGLVSVAWADGTFADREREMLDALIEGFGATEGDAKDIREYAKTERALEDIPLNELSFGDRRTLMSHAVALSWIDGDQAASEVAFLEKLREHLKVTPEEYAEIAKVQSARAQEMIHLLEAEG